MKSDGAPLRSGVVLVVMMVTSAPSLGSSPVRAAIDGLTLGSRSATTRAAYDAAGQQTAAGVDRPINQVEDDDPGGGGSPFGNLCPNLIGVPWSTKLLGTPDSDYASDLTTDDDVCAIYVAGTTYGSVAGAAGQSDGFLARYSTAGALVFGTAVDESAASVATDSQHNVYVTGCTGGTCQARRTRTRVRWTSI